MTAPLLLALLLVGLVGDASARRHKRKYDTTSRVVPGKLNLHLVCHTHDDVGWLKTLDQYYYGANNTIQNAGVQYILDTVVHELAFNKDRKFIYVETAFFARWWDEQTEEVQEVVVKLVENGQLVFINGGWSMHDEANPHYMGMVDQTTFGHQFLLNATGAVPRGGWQIDPFGHSGTQAALLSSETGFTSLYFARIDYEDRYARIKAKTTEMIWQGSHSLGEEARVFTGVFPSGNYNPPDPLNYVFSNHRAVPWMDDPTMEGMNVKELVDKVVEIAEKQALEIQGENIMFTMGSDFEYQDANHWFKNLDKLVHHVNADGRINVLYSDPNIYTEAKFNESLTWTLKTDDFMPIKDEPTRFWTGYFTSRPAFKRYTRDCLQFFTTIRQIAAAANLPEVPKFRKLIESIGAAEHHDAITGTEKQHVVFDYAKQLAIGRTKAGEALNPSLNAITGMKGKWSECVLLNTSVCPATQPYGSGSGKMGPLVMVAWNPSSQERRTPFRIPVAGPHISIKDQNGMPIHFDILESTTPITNYMPGPGSDTTASFFSPILPPMGMVTISMEDLSSEESFRRQEAEGQGEVDQSPTITNEHIQAVFIDGALYSLQSYDDAIKMNLTQQFYYYNSAQEGGVSSGAYVFRPQNPTKLVIGSPIITSVTRGHNVTEVKQRWGDWVNQTVRLYSDSRALEFEFTVGPIPVMADYQGKEVVSVFTTDIESNKEWWVDSNSRDMEYRRRNWRQSWDFKQTQPVSGNYFPTTGSVYIKDSTRQMTIYTETSQGSGSIKDGQLELMVHRRMLFMGRLGVGEILNETSHITSYYEPCSFLGCGSHYGLPLLHRSRHWLTLTEPGSAKVWRPMMDKIFYKPHLFFQSGSSPPAKSFSLLKAAMPDNIQVMTYERVNATTILLRLSHNVGVGEDPVLSKPVTVSLPSLFSKFVSAMEMTLTANQKKSAFKQYPWKVKGEARPPVRSSALAPGETSVTLKPMQIRTFYVTVSG